MPGAREPGGGGGQLPPNFLSQWDAGAYAGFSEGGCREGGGCRDPPKKLTIQFC